MAKLLKQWINSNLSKVLNTWHWQPTALRPRHKFLVKLFCISALAHGVVVFLLLFVHATGTFQHNITVTKHMRDTAAPVMFMPLVKRAGTQPARAKAVAKAPAKKAPPPKQTTIAKAPPKPKPTPKPAPKKPAPQVAKKEPPKPVVKPAAQKPEQASAAHEAGEPQPVIIGQEEFEALKLEHAVQQQVAKIWKPPVGLSQKLSAQPTVLIGHDGTIQKITMTKNSGVLAFDTSVKFALRSMSFPRMAWGKQISITFSNA